MRLGGIMRSGRILAILVGGWLALSQLQVAHAEVLRAYETVSFKSGGRLLHGLLYKPDGAGPFPALLYNHGSAPGMQNNAAFERIAPLFIARGWVFFAPYRRGQGLSAGAGRYVMDEIEAARARGGRPLAADTLVRLLTTEQLQDQMSALAWLRTQSFVRSTRIAAMGNSFGGIETVLGAERGGYCAAVDAAGGAESWEQAPNLRDVMVHGVRHAQAPLLFLQAHNDYSVQPSRVLYAAAGAAGKEAEIHLYPPYGDSPAAGHSFAWRGADVWKDDVFRFLDKHCQAAANR
jgi:dipeptidyl aminopeptidase/acylaminoacyl peptidase